MSDPAARLVQLLGDAVRQLAVDADRNALPALYAAAAVDPVATRAALRRARRPFLDPDAPAPHLAEVDHTARHLVTQTRGRAAAIGWVTGIAGWAGIPSEVAAWTIAHLRLAQRLAVVYGLDPRTERGHAAVTRAIAAGFDVELPDRGTAQLRVSDLPALARLEPPAAPAVAANLAWGVARSSARVALGRVGRLIPVIASGVSAADNAARSAEVGARMREVLRRLAVEGERDDTQVVDAIEVVRST